MLAGGASLGASQVGVLQALSEHDVVPDLVAGTSVRSLNGAALARDPTSGPNRLSHVWARMPLRRFPRIVAAGSPILERLRRQLGDASELYCCSAGNLARRPARAHIDEEHKVIFDAVVAGGGAQVR